MIPFTRTSGPLRSGLALLAVVLTLALAACSSSDDGTEGDTTVEGSTATPKTSALTIATSFGIDDLDPLANSYWGPEFGYVELLMRPEPDGVPSPWVLKSLTNVDETTWELGLRDNVEFENGTKLDAQALVDLVTFMNGKNQRFASTLNLDSVEVKDESTVKLTTRVPVPSLANALADEANLPVFDVAAYQAFLASGADPSELLNLGLYTGPYVMTSLNEQAAELAPVEKYWDGEPALSKLTLKFVPEAMSRVQAVQSGEADLALYMPIEVASTLEGRDDAFYVTGEPMGSTLAVQLRNAGAWSDTAVRRALFAAIDYRELAEDVLDGKVAIATSVYGPTVPYAIDTQKTDLDLARELLDEAGWVGGDGEIRAKDGNQLTLRLLTYAQQPDTNTLAVAMQTQLAKVGIDVKVTEVPDITAARKGTDWDAALAGTSLLSFSLSPEDGLRSALATGGSQNFMGVSNAELDGMIEELSATFDAEKRNKLLDEIQQVIHENGLWAATVMRKPAVVTNATWKGYEPPIANMWVTAKTSPAA